MINQSNSRNEADNSISAVAQSSQEGSARIGNIGRLSGMLLSPGATFADVKRRPNYVAPLMILVIAVLIGSTFFTWRVKPDLSQIIRNRITQRDTAANRVTPPEQVERQVAIGKSIAYFSPVISIVGAPAACFALAGIISLGLTLLRAQTAFRKILSVIAWSAAATRIVATLALIAVLMVRDQESLSDIDPTQSTGIVLTNLSAILSSGSPASIKSLAASFDIFTIWFLILVTIGIAAVVEAHKITIGKVGALVFGLWAIWVIVKVGLAVVASG